MSGEPPQPALLYRHPVNPAGTAKVLAEIVERLGPFPITFCYSRLAEADRIIAEGKWEAGQ